MKIYIYIIACFLFSITLYSQVPNIITYQGVLTDNTGTLVSDGNYDLTFKLYTSLTGGTSVWTEEHVEGNHVAVSNGLFTVELGSITSLSSLDFSQQYYLEIVVGTTTLSPRIAMNASGYSLNTSRATNAVITGGTINNTAIGGTTPAAGAFTTLKMTSGASNGYYLKSDADGDASWQSVTVPSLSAAETITGNWVNTTNPWADNEVADNLTISGGTVNNTIIGAATPAAGAFTTLKMTTGASNGYYLKSDADGDASWQSVTVPSLSAAETITGNWVNTTNPWADNEVVDNLTISGGTINNTAIGGTTQAAGAFSTLRVGTSTTSGYVLTADASGNGTWQAASGGGSNLPYTPISFSTTLSTANQFVMIRGCYTVTLPANPATGQMLYLFTECQTAIIMFNGKVVQRGFTDFNISKSFLDFDRWTFCLYYNGSRWLFFE